jgi:hydrogenase/urease accessory protein HupE
MRSGRAGAALVLWATAMPAYGHSPFPGFKGFYTGIGHPFTEPLHIMSLMALGLIVADRAGVRAGTAILVAMVCAVAGLAAGQALLTLNEAVVLLGAATVIIGAVAASGWTPPAAAIIVTGSVVGFLLGQGSRPDPGPFDQVLITSFGAWVGLSYLLIAVSGGTRAALTRWPGEPMQISVRVLGSWLAAAAALFLATRYWA